MKILSCGAGMQSTALALMSCENARDGTKYPLVPVYDAVIFCDLRSEAPWVYAQVSFLAKACEENGIPFYSIDTDLYGVFMRNFGSGHVTSIPFWSIGTDGKKAKMQRHCTIDYKILKVQQLWESLDRRPGPFLRTYMDAALMLACPMLNKIALIMAEKQNCLSTPAEFSKVLLSLGFEDNT